MCIKQCQTLKIDLKMHYLLAVFLINCFLCSFLKSLNDVGKAFPSRTGDLEANREKNRYPAILPCN